MGIFGTPFMTAPIVPSMENRGSPFRWPRDLLFSIGVKIEPLFTPDQPPPRTGPLPLSAASRRGDWIYHLPGQPYYAETRAEAFFCTEEEAQRAGYRASRGR